MGGEMDSVHRIITGSSSDMSAVEDGSVQLVVTSPPYPMIEMWDEQFAELDDEIGDALAAEDGERAFEAMHALLDETWEEVARVLEPGGIACINIGDATRRLDGSFEMYPNHVRIVESFQNLGFSSLPDILWRKPANSAAKFMGSGMLPPNAYVTLEHEYILVFRKGRDRRSFPSGSTRRYESAYFWEERNTWFSDVWMDVRGAHQALNSSELRERSAAYPLELPYRLINMYSAQGDTVLDPFLGTGTTSLAAMITARNSVGYELVPEFAEGIERRLGEIQSIAQEVVRERLRAHEAFVEERQAAGKDPKYESTHYGFPVTTQQEREIRFYLPEGVSREDSRFTVRHSALSRDEADRLIHGHDVLGSAQQMTLSSAT